MKSMLKNPNITQKELAGKFDKSERTIKSRIAQLQEKQLVRRVNGKKYGKWEVLIDITSE